MWATPSQYVLLVLSGSPPPADCIRTTQLLLANGPLEVSVEPGTWGLSASRTGRLLVRTSPLNIHKWVCECLLAVYSSPVFLHTERYGPDEFFYHQRGEANIQKYCSCKLFKIPKEVQGKTVKLLHMCVKCVSGFDGLRRGHIRERGGGDTVWYPSKPLPYSASTRILFYTKHYRNRANSITSSPCHSTCQAQSPRPRKEGGTRPDHMVVKMASTELCRGEELREEWSSPSDLRGSLQNREFQH